MIYQVFNRVPQTNQIITRQNTLDIFETSPKRSLKTPRNWFNPESFRDWTFLGNFMQYLSQVLVAIWR